MKFNKVEKMRVLFYLFLIRCFVLKLYAVTEEENKLINV